MNKWYYVSWIPYWPVQVSSEFWEAEFHDLHTSIPLQSGSSQLCPTGVRQEEKNEEITALFHLASSC